MLWVVMALMCLLAIAFVARSLLPEFKANASIATAVIVFVVALSLTMYSFLGNPRIPSGAGQEPDIGAMVTSLAARLDRQPDDINGWKMLGRSHMTLGNFSDAVVAFQKAIELESAENAQTLVDFGVAVAQSDGQQLSARAVSAFENALAIEPTHPEALFYGGIAAFNRGDVTLAADRWERLLDTNPPPEVRSILVERIAVWRGEPIPAGQPAVSPPASGEQTSAAVVSATVSLSGAARAALPNEATVFIIARDPAQPSPPIAVTRRALSELPAVVTLGDRDSMIPGRTLSAFAQFELVARVSVSGNPAEQPGDWFGSVIVQASDGVEIQLPIDQAVH